MRAPAAIAALLVAVAAACTPGAREAEPFQGRWQSDGHGTFMVIDGGGVEVFEHTAVSCVRIQDGAARGISDVLSFEGDRLVLDDDGRIIRFDRIDFLPDRCADEFLTGDPAFTLEVLDATFGEQYLPGVDVAWSERIDAAMALAEGTDERALVDAVIAVLEPLVDPEVRLAAPGLLDEPWVAQEPAPVARVRESLAGLGLEERDGLAFGGVDGIPYLGVRRLEAVEEVEARFAATLDAALPEAGPVIVDLRLVSGGLERLSRLVASRFVGEDTVVAVRRVVAPGGTVPGGEVTVAPLSSGVVTGTVVVLIGPGTSGAGETLAAALSGLGGVTLVGEPTAGRPGQFLVRMLPTGWTLGLPNQALVLPDGTVIGPDGLRPDVVVAAGDAGDPQLVAAVELAGS